MLELNKIYQGDCMEVMKNISDKSIDLLVTDPPYAINLSGGVALKRKLITGEAVC